MSALMATLGVEKAYSASHHKQAPPHRKSAEEPPKHRAKSETKRTKSETKRTTAAHRSERKRSAHKAATKVPLPIERPEAPDPALAALPPDLAATRQAIELVRRGKPADATALAASIADPVGQKLVEWALLRNSDSEAGFDRYAAFIGANPDWPSIPLLRRRAEARLWQDRRDPATIRRFLDGKEPASFMGRLALARALMAEGDRAGADREIRTVWRSAPMSSDLETVVLKVFHDELSSADYAGRMDWRISAKDFGAAARAAKHLGDDGRRNRQGLHGRRREVQKGRIVAGCGSRRSTRRPGLHPVPTALAIAPRRRRRSGQAAACGFARRVAGSGYR